jgi:hypothetical protein
MMKTTIFVLSAYVSGCVSAHAAETITYKYDAKGRVVEVKRSGTVNNNVQANYTYDKADNRTNVKVINSSNPAPPASPGGSNTPPLANADNAGAKIASYMAADSVGALSTATVSVIASGGASG